VIASSAGEAGLLGQERKKRRVTQDELAARIGKKVNYLKKIEAGAAYPSQVTRDAIREALSYCWVCEELSGKKHRLKEDLPPDDELYMKPPRFVERDSENA
jgi:transcriptional regulator with XRE-family HTH domain